MWTLSTGDSPYIKLTDYAVCDGVTDDTANWNAFLAAVKASDYRVGILPAKQIRFASQPDPIDTCVNLWGAGQIGAGLPSTVLIRDYAGTTNTGLIEIVAGAHGTTLDGFIIEATDNYTGGCGISLIASGTAAMNRVQFQNICITAYGNNIYQHALYVDGTALTTGAIGIRGLSLFNCDLFGANGYSAVFKGVEALDWHGGGVYPAAGTATDSGAIQITGTSAVPSNYIRMSLTNFNGLDLSYCQYGSIDAALISNSYRTHSISNTSTCQDFRVRAKVTGSVQSNWVNSSQVW